MKFIILCIGLLFIVSCSHNKAPSSAFEFQPATPHLVQTQNKAEGENIMKPFQELLTSLVSDSLSILPKSISEKISESIKDGLEMPEQDDEIGSDVLKSQDPEDIAIMAGYFVQQIYGDSVKEGATIPQTIFYLEEKNIDVELLRAKSQILTSINHDRDAYNASLNLLINALLKSYEVNNKEKSAEGIYLRDSEGELYLDKEV